MRQIIIGFFALIAALQPTLATDLKQDLQKMVERSRLKASDLGIVVMQEKGAQDETIYELNAGKRMVPASLTKIITAGCALETFPPHFQFQTQLFAADAVVGGALKGPLYLKGGGDPSFVSESMWVLVNEFLRNDIRVIEGDIIVDDSRFDDEGFDESRESRRVDRAYDAPIGAMSFNWNAVNVFVRPGARAGEPALVKIDPVNSYIHLENRARTGKEGSAKTVVASRGGGATEGDVIVVAGQIAAGADETVVFKSITQPALWSGANLQEFLSQRGITVKGHVRRGRLPTNARKLASFSSKPISQLVADMAKFSNNYVAEMLTKNFSAEFGKQPASMKEGIETVRKFLDNVGLKRAQYTLNNPSGFTRENEFAPQDLFKVLAYVRRRFKIFPEFLSALPIAGIDGTLKSRMKEKGAEWVRAKTGLLNGVVGLSGFAAKPDGTQYSFVFIYNGSVDAVEVRDLFDRLAARLTQ